MKIKLSAVFVVSTGLLVGCSNNQNHPDDPRNAANAKAMPEPALTADTRYAAGQVAESQGDTARAITQYQEALKLDPKQPLPLLRLGILYTTTQQYDAAVAIWKRYINATGGAAAGYSDLGVCLEQATRIGEAESAFRAGIAKEPANEACRVNYGLMLARQGRLGDAATQMQAVLPAAQVHYNLASVLQSQGKKDLAKAEFRKAIAANPEMTDAKERLAELDKN